MSLIKDGLKMIQKAVFVQNSCKLLATPFSNIFAIKIILDWPVNERNLLSLFFCLLFKWRDS